MTEPTPNPNRLAAAVRLSLEFRSSGRRDHAAFLDEHAALRDLIEPMIAPDDNEVEASTTATPAAPPPIAAPIHRHLTPGMLFAGYRLEAELGRGGMGTVFLAQQPGLQRQVALKVLSAPLLLVSERALWRFQREARLLAALDHPGIVKVLEASVFEGIPFFVMELVRGTSFAEVLAAVRRAGLGSANSDTLRAAVLGAVAATADATPWTRPPRYRDAVLDIVADIADALACAHAAGVVHRDVKPSNLLLRSDGAVLLADFGVAHQDGGTQLTVTGDLAGTPTHMSPEQAKGLPVDHRSDVFSLGIVLYEALTLQLPFPGDNQAEIRDRLLHHDPKDPLQLDPTLGRDTAAVLGKALEKDPARRYQTASAFAADLRAARAGLPVTARRPGRLERLGRWARREPWQATTAAIATIALATVVIVDRLHTERLRAEGERTARALAEVQRLAIGVRLERAEAERKRFRMARTEDVPTQQQWLREHAEPLLAELPGLERLLEELRREAFPYGDAEAAADHANHPEAAELARLESELQFQEQRIADGDPKALPTRRDHLLQERGPLRERVMRRRTWRFDDENRQFLHDQVVAVAARLQAFGNPDGGPVVAVRDGIRSAAESQRRCLDEPAQRWREIAADVAADARFGGLQLRPQHDLLPLRKDPKSGLWEFLHFHTTAADYVLPNLTQDQPLVPEAGMGIVLVLLPGGTFTMGAQSSDPHGPNYDPGAKPDESPLRQITLDPFFCSKYEMTQAQWLRTTGENPSWQAAEGRPESSPLQPLDGASLQQARSELGNLWLDLPTEAQWEYACRAGTTTPWSFGERSAAPRHANFADQSSLVLRRGATAEPALDDGHAWKAKIGSFAPNAFGLHDMHGNVAEFTVDFWSTYDRGVQPGDGASIADYPQQSRCIRGGHCAVVLATMRSAARNWSQSQTFVSEQVGVRAVRTVER